MKRETMIILAVIAIAVLIYWKSIPASKKAALTRKLNNTRIDTGVFPVKIGMSGDRVAEIQRAINMVAREKQLLQNVISEENAKNMPPGVLGMPPPVRTVEVSGVFDEQTADVYQEHWGPERYVTRDRYEALMNYYRTSYIKLLNY